MIVSYCSLGLLSSAHLFFQSGYEKLCNDPKFRIY